MPATTTPPELLGKIRTLIQDKTRFEPEDIQAVTEQDDKQNFTLVARYRLAPDFRQKAINGFFQPEAEDCPSISPLESAESAAPARLRLAAQALRQQLSAPDAPYDGIPSGLLLAHQARYWRLDGCSSCGATGLVVCHTCAGRKTETCPNCHGHRRVTCTAYGCMYGQVNCSTCGGLGQVSREVSYTVQVDVPTTTWHNGESQTSYHREYRTEYKTELHTCPNGACSHGRVMCSQCSGSGQISCPTCGASGSIRCRTCDGHGQLRCDPCAGSGSRGAVVWVDIGVETAYELQLPESADETARTIIGQETPAQIAALASSLALRTIDSPDDPPSQMQAMHDGRLRIVHLHARCNGKDYQLVAYGKALKWLSTDGMVEDLLRNDLEQLAEALATSSRAGYLACDIASLAGPLRQVAASELNADIVEASLAGKTEAHAGVVSKEYAHRVSASLLDALQRIHIRTAKRLAWQAALAVSLLMLLVWAFSDLTMAAISGTTALAGAYWVFRRQIRQILTQTLGDAGRAKRATGMMRDSQRGRGAIALIVLPGLICLLLLGYSLPETGIWHDVLDKVLQMQ